jgi:putative FmdB family regulatory protein
LTLFPRAPTIEVMPLYEYECKKCGHRFEKIQLFSDPMLKKCPECGGKIEQMISAPAIQFKGSGWYVNDYAKKPGPSASSGKNGNESGKADSVKAESSESDPGSKSKTESESNSKSDSDSKTVSHASESKKASKK